LLLLAKIFAFGSAHHFSSRAYASALECETYCELVMPSYIKDPEGTGK